MGFCMIVAPVLLSQAQSRLHHSQSTGTVKEASKPRPVLVLIPEQTTASGRTRTWNVTIVQKVKDLQRDQTADNGWYIYGCHKANNIRASPELDGQHHHFAIYFFGGHSENLASFNFLNPKPRSTTGGFEEITNRQTHLDPGDYWGGRGFCQLVMEPETVSSSQEGGDSGGIFMDQVSPGWKVSSRSWVTLSKGRSMKQKRYTFCGHVSQDHLLSTSWWSHVFVFFCFLIIFFK